MSRAFRDSTPAVEFLARYEPLLRVQLRPRDPVIAAAFDAARERLGIRRRSLQMSIEDALVVRDGARADGDPSA